MSADTPRITTHCGCGYPLIWVGGHWEHDAAPYLWGDDHDPKAPEPTGPDRAYWDAEDLGAIPVKPRVPDFKSRGTGGYYGDAYPQTFEYTLRCTGSKDDGFTLIVENDAGGEVESLTFDADEADGIQKVGNTDHSIDAYGDDWKFPSGIDRVLTWAICDHDYNVVLDEGQISELGRWLDYALGDTEYVGPDEWEY